LRCGYRISSGGVPDRGAHRPRHRNGVPAAGVLAQPLLAGFPVYLALGVGLRSFAPWINTGLILGTLGLLIGGLRIFQVLVKDAGSEQVLILGDKYDRAMVITLSIILGLLGFFPQFLFRITQAITELMIGL
ncbi:MAG: hypothetical protein ACK2TZ_12955, partial [Anaerolineales bacterium]